MNVELKRPSGEYDPPLPEKIKNPTKADKDKLDAILMKYRNMAKERDRK